MRDEIRIGVVGLGYVGLPIAVAFARAGFQTVGFDINPQRIDELVGGYDRTREVESGDLKEANVVYSNNVRSLAAVNFFIVTVPTPLDHAKRPDLSMLFSASEFVGSVLSRGDIVVYESTVYPGVTENECAPYLEKASGLVAGRDFFLGYSPERINPGDKEHRFENIAKIVAGQNQKTLETMTRVYGAVIKAPIHKAPNIMTAEAAKVIENTQRDLNIALINELSLIFKRLGIDTGDVLAAAKTKWNFLPFSPGLVGGHCIGVDPYYLTHMAEQIGYHPEVILAGRRVNDSMSKSVADECARVMMMKKLGQPLTVTILGLAFKENVPDIRNSRVGDTVKELEKYGINVQVHDPVVDRLEAMKEYGLSLFEFDDLAPADAVIIAVPHKIFSEYGWRRVSGLLKLADQGIVFDLKGMLPRSDVPSGVHLSRL